MISIRLVRTSCVLLAFTVMVLAAASPVFAADKKPNILVIWGA